MREILELAIRYEGSTLGDGTYRNALNKSGGYQNAHRVYDREGEACPTCGRGEITRIMQGQRSTFFCAKCQRVGRIEALSFRLRAQALSLPQGCLHGKFGTEWVGEKEVVARASKRSDGVGGPTGGYLLAPGRRISMGGMQMADEGGAPSGAEQGQGSAVRPKWWRE